MKRIKIDYTGYAGDPDYRLALEELNFMFPGIPRDDSMIEYLHKQGLMKELKKRVLKFGLSLIIVVTMISLLKFVFPVFILLPALYFVMKKDIRPFPR